MIKYNKEITKEEINELKQVNFKGKIHLIVDKTTYQEALKSITKADALGFDTETRPAFKKGEHHDVAILQLATETEAFVFRLTKYPLQKEIIEILSNPQVLKAGGAIERDVKELQELYHFKPAGFVEIQDLAKEKGIKKLGLRSLTAILLGKRLAKGSRLTNWEKDHLNEVQINYAATDAWIGLKIYKELTIQKLD